MWYSNKVSGTKQSSEVLVHEGSERYGLPEKSESQQRKPFTQSQWFKENWMPSGSGNACQITGA